MSSRQEEKERRRREREERERAVAAKASSRRRLQLVAGAVLAVAAIAAVIAAIVSGSSGSSSGSKAAAKIGKASIPAQKITDFNAAVKAAGCEYKNYPSEGRQHLTSDTATFNKYKTNPPSSGTHRPTAAEDGVYARNNPPAKENAVHALEHGRIEIQYAPSVSNHVVAQLNTLFNEPVKGVAGYHELLFQNQTKMPFAVAAVAWTNVLGCKTMNPQVFDAIRAFRDRFVDKGPELIM